MGLQWWRFTVSDQPPPNSTASAGVFPEGHCKADARCSNQLKLCNSTTSADVTCCRDDMESTTAYVPLGPRNTFPFVPRDNVPAALDRSLFFNLQVG